MDYATWRPNDFDRYCFCRNLMYFYLVRTIDAKAGECENGFFNTAGDISGSRSVQGLYPNPSDAQPVILGAEAKNTGGVFSAYGQKRLVWSEI
jgi:hypothetical protein